MAKLNAVKGRSFAALKAEAFKNDEVLGTYLAEQRKEELSAAIIGMRRHAGLSSVQIADKMGLSLSSVLKIEKYPERVSFERLDAYAIVCGFRLKISI
ncbi:helix-turn-helix transcriptional regulator [Shewanella sp. ZOR0012]|uniref:helix-turn-helix domain-containing protein n=1 Tax=Shewanella sp. ZOR0012 TaxID=1339231 RepID=UPI00064677C4|nr:helix-turn-helix transcriptional regulator [Shewanella sp. ZOR0012]NSM23937.1 helix-turn-helix transcriptional regulator [Shewanella sp. ZOR0012]